ncbi:response regulator transcription factor [bacterium]|nr:response regulator transcription factor [bacterium]
MVERILIVEDEREIVRVLRGYLEAAGFQVLEANDGKEGLRIARQEKPALVLLDLMLPKMDGLDVCRALRRDSNVPIIMITARVEEADRLVGLELGADDYVVKPFSPREVVARVRALLRRVRMSMTGPERGEIYEVGDLCLDTERRSVTVGGRPVSLTRTEFEILRALVSRPGRVLTRLQLLEVAQGEAYEGYERTVDSHIKNIRRKIEPDTRNPRYILTVHGVGYKAGEG